MIKKTKIQVVQHDLLENSKTLVYKGVAILDTAENLIIKYEESDNISVVLELENQAGILKRIGETKTLIYFNLQEPTVASFESEFGTMDLDVKTEEITLNKDNWVLGYSLLQDGNIVSQFSMKVECVYE